jgi:virulence-associated protein VagC
MTTAKIFQHGGSKVVRLPKAFRFPIWQLVIENHGDEVVLLSISHSQFKSFTQIARHLAKNFPIPASDLRPPASEALIF